MIKPLKLRNTGLPRIFSQRRRKIFVRLVMNGFIQSVMIICSMILVRYGFDVLLNPAFDDPEVHLFELTDVWIITLFAIGLLTSTGTVVWLRQRERLDAELLGQDYIHRIRLHLYDRMSNFAPRATSYRRTGSTMLRFVGDLAAIRRWVSLGLARIVVSSIVTFLSLGYLFIIDVHLAVAVVTLLFIGMFWNMKLGPRMQRAVIEARKRRGRMAGNINEKIRTFIVIQAFNQEQRERRRFSRHSQNLREAMINRTRASSFMRIINEGATAVAMGVVLSLGAYEVFRGETTSGNVVAAMAVIGFLSTAFRDIGRVHEYYRSALVSVQKIQEFKETKKLRGRSTTLPSLEITQGQIEFRNISLKGALHKISAIGKGGNRIALVGPNGAGKSTLLHVAARLIDPDRGKVLIDGQDISKCNLASVRREIGIVSHDLPLMRGSVRYNLCYRWPDAPEEEVAKVRELCDLDEMIMNLKGGDKYRLQEGGQNLSLGQRHRLSLGRALLGNPSILIIDEIDANLDEQASLALTRVLNAFNGTVLIVSRLAENVAQADCIWHMEEGLLKKIERRSGQTEKLLTGVQG